MRILQTVEFYYPFQEMGGPVVKVREIAAGLAKRGHSVTILTPDWGFQPSQAPEMRAVKIKEGWRAEENGVETSFLPIWWRYRALAFCPAALRFARKELSNYDVVHCYGLYDFLGPSVAVSCRARGVPYFIEPMGMFKPIVRNVPLKRVYQRLARRRFLSGARDFIATSEQERAEIASSGISREHIFVRRNGVRGPATLPAKGAFREKWNVPPNAKFILFLGRIVAKKNPDLLIRAFSDWLNRNRANSTAYLAIAGPAEEKSYLTQLKAMSSSMGLDSRVLFPGALYDSEKWEAYCDADLFVLPSQNENFGNSAAEALTCGTPVIVSDQCGIAPLVRDRAGLVVPPDRTALADALKSILENPELHEKFQKGSVLLAQELSWEEPILQMEEVYRSALNELPGRIVVPEHIASGARQVRP